MLAFRSLSVCACVRLHDCSFAGVCVCVFVCMLACVFVCSVCWWIVFLLLFGFAPLDDWLVGRLVA